MFNKYCKINSIGAIRRGFSWFFILSNLALIVRAQGLPPVEELSGQTQISLLTAEPGVELYAAFGHSAIRVQDPVNRVDVVFNYGIFDFNAPNFYVKFVRGKLNYMMGASRFHWFVNNYQAEHRTVYENVLNLDSAEVNKLYELLSINFLPENRFYLYDFFFNNCATRIRDIVQEALGGKIVFKGDHLAEKLTFRGMIDRYLEQNAWGDLGIDLALGAKIDREMKTEEYMYHPVYLMYGFENAVVGSEERALVGKRKVLVNDMPVFEDVPLPLHPLFVTSFVMLLVLLLTWRELKTDMHFRWLDVILFILVGLAGWILFLLWVATDHSMTGNNYNLLWAIPLHLPFGILLLFKKFRGALSTYFLIAAGLCAGVLLGWFILPQELNYYLIPLILSLALRSVLLWQRLKG